MVFGMFWRFSTNQKIKVDRWKQYQKIVASFRSDHNSRVSWSYVARKLSMDTYKPYIGVIVQDLGFLGFSCGDGAKCYLLIKGKFFEFEQLSWLYLGIRGSLFGKRMELKLDAIYSRWTRGQVNWLVILMAGQWKFPYIGLIYGRYLQFRILKWPLIMQLFSFQVGFAHRQDQIRSSTA